MPEKSELARLLALVKYDPHLYRVEGIDPVRALLDQDRDGTVAQALRIALLKLADEARGDVAFLLANHWLVQGDLKGLQDLFAIDDPGVKA